MINVYQSSTLFTRPFASYQLVSVDNVGRPCQIDRPMTLRFVEIDDQEVESVSNAAKRVGVSSGYLYKLIRDRKLKAIELEGRLLLISSDIDSLIQKRKAS